ncbi:ATP-binding protein [soil metagenome]
MIGGDRRPTLRREIVVWYSIVLLVALGVFTLLTYLLLQRALERASTASLRQTAQTVEQLSIPARIPRIATDEQIVELAPAGPGGQRLEALRRRTLLATGDSVEIIVARSDDVEARVLRSFLLISLLLIPLTAIAAALGGRMLIERLLHPLSRLVGATREIGIGGLSRRVAEPERPAELRDLAKSFNEMLVRLERAVGTLRNFTADASHELRTPLTSIRGIIQVALARQRSEEELQDTLAEVMEETESMLHLVDGLLTLARGEEELNQTQRETIDLVPLLADLADVAGALVAGKPVTVSLSTPAELPVHGSAGQLRQVFLNLISNAAKFTERGSISIAADVRSDPATEEQDGREADGHTATLAVVLIQDTGAGISKRELPRVFDRFYRGDAARAQVGGTGLGLAIAKLLVEQHGGEIHARSKHGFGSEFEVVLPLSSPPALRTHPAEKISHG